MAESGGTDLNMVNQARAHADLMDAWPTKKVPDLPQVGEMFVTVPATDLPEITLPNGVVIPAMHVPEFKVAKYLSTVVDGKAVISPDDVPTVETSYFDTVAICDDSGLPLIRETQAISLAWNIYHVDENWTGGKVGDGRLFQGLHKGTVDEAQSNDFESGDPEERRWFKLPNGEVIFDVAGHLYTWTFDDIQGDERGVVKQRFSEGSRSIVTAPLSSMEKGIGWYPDAGDNLSGSALVRGGCWDSNGGAGVFRLGGGSPGCGGDGFGFRSTKPSGI